MYEGGMQGHSSIRPRRRQDDIISQSEPSKLIIGTDHDNKAQGWRGRVQVDRWAHGEPGEEQTARRE